MFSLFLFKSKPTIASIPDRRMVLATMTRDQRITRNAWVGRAERTNA